MAISRSQLVKELEPGLNALFGLEYKQYENQSAEIYWSLCQTNFYPLVEPLTGLIV